MIEDTALAGISISETRRTPFPIRVMRGVGEAAMRPGLRPINDINAGLLAHAIMFLPQTDKPISDEALAEELGFGRDPMAIAKVSVEVAVLFDHGIKPLDDDGPLPRYKLVDPELLEKTADNFIKRGIIPQRQNLPKDMSPDY